MFDSNQFFVSEEDDFYPHTIGQSLRFDGSSSSYLRRTPSSAGNRQTWTWSAWVKRGNLTQQRVLDCWISSGNQTWIEFTSSGELSVGSNTSSIATIRLTTQSVYRDVGAWYHIQIEYDSTQSIASDRVKMYVNGGRVTSFASSSYPSSNYSTWINSSNNHDIGRLSAFDGYMAEVNFIDGQALDADSFGEFKSGVWIPKEYTGSYGTNGFYLNFSGNIGDDSSGNGNNWTANNLASTDIVLDSPTNNFATLNPIATGSNATSFQEGSTQVSLGADNTGRRNCYSTIKLPTSGKWYFETLHTRNGLGLSIGIRETSSNDKLSNAGYSYYNANGNKSELGTSSSYGSSFFAVGVTYVVACYYDADTGNLGFTLDGVDQGVAFTVPTGKEYYATVSNTSGGSNYIDVWLNFGQDSSFAGNKTAQGNTDANGIGDFYYEPPEGYLALCTANLPEPVFSPAKYKSPQDHFNTVTYTGTASDIVISNVGFQSDLIWIKQRNVARDHNLQDVLRGFIYTLESNNTEADRQNTNPYVQSVNSDGYTVWGGSSNVNASGGTYVAWNWKANGTGVTNTDGSITSTVSANVDAGFSIVSWSGTGSNATVGHGLDKAPDLVIVKNRSTTGDWRVYHSSVCDGTNYLFLNSSSAQQSASVIWNNTIPNDTVFSIGSHGSVNGNGNNLIAYCFHSVDGFSKFGSYTGNGSATDGPFLYTGFRPAFVMFKRTEGITDWFMYDNARDPDNPANARLLPNSNSAEVTDIDTFDFTSNGFKIRTAFNAWNKAGNNYIYIAFAENPFKYANAR